MCQGCAGGFGGFLGDLVFVGGMSEVCQGSTGVCQGRRGGVRLFLSKLVFVERGVSEVYRGTLGACLGCAHLFLCKLGFVGACQRCVRAMLGACQGISE